MTEDETVECHHRLNGYEFERTPGDEGQKPDVLQSMGMQSQTCLSDSKKITTYNTHNFCYFWLFSFAFWTLECTSKFLFEIYFPFFN